MIKIKTVEQLRAEGLKVWVTHERPYVFPPEETIVFLTEGEAARLENPGNITLLQKGGKTTVRITTESLSVIGYSVCSFQDTFNKKKGLLIALSRALFALNSPEEARRRRERSV